MIGRVAGPIPDASEAAALVLVANLVDNAVAHPPEGSPVRVEAGEVGSKV